jgi:hypothetical protein
MKHRTEITFGGMAAMITEDTNPREDKSLTQMAIFTEDGTFGDSPRNRPDGCESLVELRVWLKQATARGDVRLYQSLYRNPEKPYEFSIITYREPAVGVVYITKARAQWLYGWKRFTAKRRSMLRSALIKEVAIYNHYLAGRIYGYAIYGPVANAQGGRDWIYGGTHFSSYEEVERRARANLYELVAKERRKQERMNHEN